jgi:KamA family protein
LDEWAPAFTALAEDPTIEEVILSGGDPLVMTDDWLGRLAGELASIPHLRRLRVHTRLPIVIPERVTDELIAWLTGHRLTPIVVVHANHPRELDGAVSEALVRLASAGVLLFNQAVLLRGVNDEVESLVELSSRLIDLRVTPCYLHQLDRVQGAAHFEVSEAEGRSLIAALQRRLPGYAIPRYVREIEGAPSKVLLA